MTFQVSDNKFRISGRFFHRQNQEVPQVINQPLVNDSLPELPEDNEEHHRLLDRIKAVLINISNSQQKDTVFQMLGNYRPWRCLDSTTNVEGNQYQM
jgi:hypothetical protein